MEKVRRYDDPISILVVDDKPAIASQIRTALEGTPWKVTSADQPGQALDMCMEQGVDLVLASLSLPNDGAYMLFQNLRSYSNTASIPVLGLSVKTAASEQTRAQQAGFSSIITKPIAPEELKFKVCRALRLETSYKYFQQRESWLALTLPKDVNQAVLDEVSKRLSDQLAGTVEAGGNKLIVDLSQSETVTLTTVELVLSAIQICSKLAIRYAIVGSEAVLSQCRAYEETQSWMFAKSADEALALLK